MSEYLVTTEWLEAHLSDPQLRIIDIRGRVLPASEPLPHYYAHHEEYHHSHIPNALFVDWTKDIVEPGSLSQDIASPDQYAELMSRLGISDSTFVVVYDDAGGIFSARMWWSLNYYGHSKVAVLDGGWLKWIKENRPTSEIIPTVKPSSFIPRIQPEWRVTAQDVLGNGAKLPLIDVRTPEEYAGKSSRAKRKGHIPNAINVPRGTLITPDGTMPNAEYLRQHFAELGISIAQNPENIVLYCNAGVSASYGLLALKVAGYSQGSVYDGSWKDWGNDDTKPIVSAG